MLLLAAVAFALAGRCAPTGLQLMPTASVLPFGVSRFDYDMGSSIRLNAPSGGRFTGTQTGLFPETMEGGVDEVSGVGAVYNFKMRIVQETGVMPAVVFGQQDIRRGNPPTSYAAVSKHLGEPGDEGAQAAIHAGVIRSGGTDTQVTGVEASSGAVRVSYELARGGGAVRRATAAGLTMGAVTLYATRVRDGMGPGRYVYSLAYYYAAGE